MKLVIVSDLHVDIGSQPPIIWPEGDVLVIAGDTANYIGGVHKLIDKVADKYELVVLVDGNHEHYSNTKQQRTIDQTIEHIVAQLPSNVKLLGVKAPATDVVVYKDKYAFVGCNGWYGGNNFDIDYWKSYMNDFHYSFITNPDYPNFLAKRDADHIRSSLDALGDSLIPIVVTHTAPSTDTLLEKKYDLDWNRANAFYFNPHMTPLLERKLLWIHGHTHFRNVKDVGQSTVVVNPRGYPTENSSWSPIVWEL